MQRSLVSRLEELEQRVGTADGIVIIRTFVSPSPNGPVKSEPRAFISLTHDWRVEREPGEPADAFIRRAGQVAPCTPGCITRLLEELGGTDANA